VCIRARADDSACLDAGDAGIASFSSTARTAADWYVAGPSQSTSDHAREPVELDLATESIALVRISTSTIVSHHETSRRAAPDPRARRVPRIPITLAALEPARPYIGATSPRRDPGARARARCTRTHLARVARPPRGRGGSRRAGCVVELLVSPMARPRDLVRARREPRARGLLAVGEGRASSPERRRVSRARAWAARALPARAVPTPRCGSPPLQCTERAGSCREGRYPRRRCVRGHRRLGAPSGEAAPRAPEEVGAALALDRYGPAAAAEGASGESPRSGVISERGTRAGLVAFYFLGA